MSSPEFFDEKTHELLAQEANLGVCSILVSNVLIQAESLSVDGGVGEVYSPDMGDFVPLPKRKQSLRERFLNEPNANFRPVAKVTGLACGIDAELGYFEQIIDQNDIHASNVKVTLGLRSVDNLTIPLADFYDMRPQKKPDAKELRETTNRCSYATIRNGYHAFGDNIITTTADEKDVIVAMRDSRGLVLAKDVLGLIQQLHTTDSSRARDTLVDFLSIDEVMREAFGLDAGRDYSSEVRLRKHIAQLALNSQNFGKPILAYENEVRGAGGPATNRVERIWFDRTVGGQGSLIQTFQYPEAIDPDPRQVLHLSIGKRIGQTSLISCVDVHKTAEQTIAYFDEVLGTPSHDYSDMDQLQLQREEIVQQAKSFLRSPTGYHKKWEVNGHIGEWIDEYNLGLITVENIYHISQAIISKTLAPAEALRLVYLPGKRGSKENLYLTINHCLMDMFAPSLQLQNVPIVLPDANVHKRSKIARMYSGKTLQKPTDLPFVPANAENLYKHLINSGNRQSSKAQVPISPNKIINRWLNTGSRGLMQKASCVRFTNVSGISGVYLQERKKASKIKGDIFVLPLIVVPTELTHKWG